MAASALTVQAIANTGTVVTLAAANVDGNWFINNGKTFLEVANGGGSPINVIIDSPITCNQGGTHDVTVAVAAGATKHIGPFEKGQFNDTTTGYVNITYSGVTSVTIAAVSI
jgi:hypothetical protein